MPSQRGVLARNGRFRDADIGGGVAADRQLQLVQREEFTDDIGRVRRVGHEQALSFWRKSLRLRAAERRPRIQARARHLLSIRRELKRVEKAHITRKRTVPGFACERVEDLPHFVDCKLRRHIEHDLLPHGLSAGFVAGLGHPTGPHFQQRQSQSVDVVLLTRAAAAKPLGSHVVRGTAVRWRPRPSRRATCTLLRETKIENDRSVIGDHDVTGLEVTVNEASRMNGCESTANLGGDFAKFVGVVAAGGLLATDVSVKRLTRDVLHHEDGPPRARREVVHATHVGVTHGTREDRLLPKRLIVARLSRFIAHHLQRHGLLS